MDPRFQLYSRQQMIDRTKIDVSTLNYWMREGVLRAIEGGGGKGQHRRFTFAEVNLAAIFGELKKFGGSILELRKLSAQFHAAEDYMLSIGVDRRNFREFTEALEARWALNDSGYVLHLMGTGMTRRYQEHAPWMLDLERHKSTPSRSLDLVHLSEEQHLAFLDVAHLVFGHNTPHVSPEFREVFKRTASIERREFQRHEAFWSVATRFITEEPGEDFRSSPDFFYQEADGEWVTFPDAPAAGYAAISFIGIDVERLSYRTWCTSAASDDMDGTPKFHGRTGGVGQET